MEIKDVDQIMIKKTRQKDALDTPDCFGDFNKKSKLCSGYCPLSIKCCILQNKNPKIDILEKLLIHNHFDAKLN